MSKVHITLVGKQTMPVYNGIKYCNPDKVLFIYSKESEKEKQLVKNYLIESKMFDAQDILKSDVLDSVNFEKVEAAAEEYKKRFVNDEVSLNISGGTKTWSYYFSKAFEDCQNAKIFYIDQNNICYDFKARTAEKFETDILLQFTLNGNPLTSDSYTDFNDYTEKDISIISEIEELRAANPLVFTKLTNIENHNTSDTKMIGYSYFEWSENSCRLCIQKDAENLIEKELISPNILKIIFRTAWFELKVADILSKWDKAKHVYMNCKFPLNNQSDGRLKKIKNEIDIIVDTGDKALFVECKTHTENSTDIDKFKNAVEKYGGKGSKAIFITLDNIEDNVRETIKESDLMSYSFKESGDLSELYDMLNRKIFTINK